jgi:hypothetical protein
MIKNRRIKGKQGDEKILKGKGMGISKKKRGNTKFHSGRSMEGTVRSMEQTERYRKIQGNSG